MRTRRLCRLVIGCPNPHYAKGLCKKHYTQIERHGRVTPERERGQVHGCSAPACDRRGSRRSGDRRYCSKHLRQVRAHGRLTPEREHEMGHSGCSVPGCPYKHRAKGFCATHYNTDRWRRVKRVLERAREAGVLET